MSSHVSRRLFRAKIALPTALATVGLVAMTIPSAAQTTSQPTNPAAGGAVAATSGALSTRVFAVGDIGLCGKKAAKRIAAVAKLLTKRAGPVLALGDLAYPKGSKTNFAQCYKPSFGKLKKRTWPVPGNHEYVTPRAADYFSYFGKRVGTPAKPYYSRNFGSWHFVMLNSNCVNLAGGCAPHSAEYRWLQADLAAHPNACLAAAWHHPMFSSTPKKAETNAAPLFSLLQNAGADLLLVGHQHNYERFLRMGINGQPASSGIRQFSVGTGGAEFYPFATAVAGSRKRVTKVSGALQLDLRRTGYSWKFLATTGKLVRDRGSDHC